MLTRILVDNPGQPFTRNFDKQFVATMKELLREGKDLSVQQILRETLDYFDMEKLRSNDTLGPLVEMWRKEKSKTTRMYGNYAVSLEDGVLWTAQLTLYRTGHETCVHLLLASTKVALSRGPEFCHLPTSLQLV